MNYSQKIKDYTNSLYRSDGYLNAAILRRNWFKESPEFKTVLEVTKWYTTFLEENYPKKVLYTLDFKISLFLIKNNITSPMDLPKCPNCQKPIPVNTKFKFSQTCSRSCAKNYFEDKRHKTYIKNKAQKTKNEVLLSLDEMLDIINKYINKFPKEHKKDINFSEDLRLKLGINKTYLYYLNKLPKKYQNLNAAKIMVIFKNNLNIPECKNPRCHNLVNIGIYGFHDYCSNECKYDDFEKTQEKMQSTCLEKYGYKTVFQVPVIQEKVKQTMLKKYGVEHPSQSKIILEKMQSTCLERYGYKIVFQVPFIKEKSKQTMINRYGFGYTFQISEFKEKSKKTCLEKYGFEYYSQTNEFKEKYKQTMLKNYGFEYYSQTNEFKEKYKQTTLKNYGVEHYSHLGLTNGYKWYSYILPSGRIIKYQGYEGKYIPVLIRKYGEENIRYNGETPRIKYELDNKKHYYFPDFYIPSENLIIEVKSKYTLNADLTKNNAKFEAVKNQGYKFKLKIFKN